MTTLPNIFAHNRRVSAAATANIGLTAHPRVSLAGDRFTLIDADGTETPWTQFQLPVIIIGSNPNDSRLYFGGPYNPNDPQPPVCWSDNGVAASKNASSPQARTCAECRHNERGSATTFTGKETTACTVKKKLALRVVGDPNRLTYELQIPPASLTNLKRYAKELEKNVVPGGGRPTDLSDVVTLLTIEAKRLKFANVGWISCLDADDNWHQNGAPDGGLAIATEIAEICEGTTIDELVGLNDEPWRGQLEGTVLPPLGGAPTLPPPEALSTAAGFTQSQSPFAGPHPLQGPAAAPQPQAAGEPPKRGRGRPPKTVVPAPKEALQQPAPTQAPWATAPAPQASNGMAAAVPTPTALHDAILAAMAMQTK